MTNVNLERLKPTRATLVALAGLLWAVSFGALRDFVWSDIRAGLIDLRGLTRSTRVLVWFGFGLLAAVLAALLYNDALRAQFALIANVRGVPGRGALLPVILVPITLFLLSIAWAFLLTGALHAHLLIRAGICLFYFFTSAIRVIVLVFTILGAGEGANPGAWLSLGALLAVPIFFALRGRKRPRPIAEFTVLLILVALTYATSQSVGVASWRAFGIPNTLAELQSNIEFPVLVIMPLLLFFGIDVANFARRAAGWAVDIVTLRMARWALGIILAGVLAWRVLSVVQSAAERAGELSAFAGALVIPALTFALWWLTTRPPVVAEARSSATREGSVKPQPAAVGGEAERVALPLIVVYYVLSLVSSLALGTTSSSFDPSGLVVSIGALGIAAWLVRHAAQGTERPAQSTGRRRGAAVYLGTFGALSLWREVTRPGMPLAALGVATGGQALVDFWWVMILALVAVVWLIRRAFTAERAARLLFLLLITFLVQQTSFIESPFSPFLAFAGIGFMVFGIAWDVITKGFWTNQSTRGLPRVSRLFLYVGYVLLTATLINWSLTTHDLENLSWFTGNLADVGFGRFGKPMLYAIIAATIALPAHGIETTPTAADEHAV